MKKTIKSIDMLKEFTTQINIRYSDKIMNGKIHPSTYLGFFETARFDVMDKYYEYLSEKSVDSKMLKNDLYYVVTSVDFTNIHEFDDRKNINVVSTLEVPNIPLLIFTQTAKSLDGKIEYAKATIKNALVCKDNFQMLKKWDNTIYNSMLDFSKQ